MFFFPVSGVILFLALNLSATRACIFWIEAELSLSLEMKLMYHSILLLTLFRINNIFYY